MENFEKVTQEGFKRAPTKEFPEEMTIIEKKKNDEGAMGEVKEVYEGKLKVKDAIKQMANNMGQPSINQIDQKLYKDKVRDSELTTRRKIINALKKTFGGKE